MEGKSVKYVVLLRGINVGGHNRIKMAELKQQLIASGLENVATYIQSGNIVLSTRETAAEVGDQVTAIIEKHWGFNIPVVVRDESSIKKVVQGNPFSDKDLAKLHVLFLGRKVTKREVVKHLDDLAVNGEQFEPKGDCLYLYCPNGVARSKLTNVQMEKRLKTVTTARNWKTTLKLQEMLSLIER